MVVVEEHAGFPLSEYEFRSLHETNSPSIEFIIIIINVRF